MSLERRQVQILRAAFLAGAITDALALVPMLFPCGRGGKLHAGTV